MMKECRKQCSQFVFASIVLWLPLKSFKITLQKQKTFYAHKTIAINHLCVDIPSPHPPPPNGKQACKRIRNTARKQKQHDMTSGTKCLQNVCDIFFSLPLSLCNIPILIQKRCSLHEGFVFGEFPFGPSCVCVSGRKTSKDLLWVTTKLIFSSSLLYFL